MSWTGVITTAGKNLIDSCVSGGLSLSIDGLKSGSGTTSETATQMRARTDLQVVKDSGVGVTTGSQTTVESVVPISEGVQFRMRVGPATDTVGIYTLHEIGLFASATDGVSTTRAMIAYYRNDDGVDIPLNSSFPDFAYILASLLAISNDLSITIDMSGASYVSSSDFDDAVDQLEASIAEKLSTDAGVGNSGKFMTVDSSGNIVPNNILMTGATSGSAGATGLVPAPAAGDQVKYLRADGSWQVPTNTTYSASTGLSLNSSNQFSLADSGVTAGNYGPSANVSGSNGATISVPYITVDRYGRITGISNKTYTSVDTTYSAGTGISKSNANAFSLADSGVTAGSYGPSANVTGNNGNTINVPYITVDRYGRVTSVSNKVYTSVNTNTTYSGGTGISLSGTTFSLSTSGVSAGTYGPSANVSGTNGTTINVPQITVDAYGRVTSVTNRVYTSVNTDTNTTYSAGNGLSLSGTTFSMSGSYSGNFTATKVYNAVWNDFAECREADTVEAGRCVCESKDRVMKITSERLMPGCKIVSDTFGACMGETEKAKTPVAVAGRVLAYPNSDPSDWELGAAVCSGPNGTVDIMTREEIREYPERIVGTVSEIPDYEYWQAGDKDNPVNIKVNGRVWIYVR